MVVVADRPPPQPRGERAAVKIDGATGGCRGNKGPDGGAANAPLVGGRKALNEGKEKASAGILGCKPEEQGKREASGCEAISPGTGSAPSELGKVDIASYQGPVRPRHWHQGKKKGLDVRSTETAMTGSIGEEVKASPLPIVNLENKGKSRSGDRSNETASASMPGKAAQASPPRGVKSDNKGKKKPSGGRQVSVAPSSDLPDGKKVEALGCEGIASGVSNALGEQANADCASYRMPLKPMYKRKGKKGYDGRSTETATTIVASKVTDTSLLEGVNSETKGNKGLIEQGPETALAIMPVEEANTSLARGFKSENKGKKESSGGRHGGMAGMKAQLCPAAEDSGSYRSNDGQGTTWEAKTEGLHAKQTVVEVNVRSNPAAEGSSYLRSIGDQGMIQAAKADGSEEKQRVVEMRTTAQLKPCDMRYSGRQRPGGHSRVNVTARQHGMVWMPKTTAALDSVEVAKFP